MARWKAGGHSRTIVSTQALSKQSKLCRKIVLSRVALRTASQARTNLQGEDIPPAGRWSTKTTTSISTRPFSYKKIIDYLHYILQTALFPHDKGDPGQVSPSSIPHMASVAFDRPPDLRSIHSRELIAITTPFPSSVQPLLTSTIIPPALRSFHQLSGS